MTLAALATLEATDTPDYRLMVHIKAFMHEKYIRPIRGTGGIELYHVFMHPNALAQLKLDSDFIDHLRHAMPRSEMNQLFKGTPLMNAILIDGMAIHAHRHVFNTLGTATKWGSGTNVEGCAMLVCGAQSLGMADIGPGSWVEKDFDYDNQPGISYGKIFGFKKPVFRSQYETTPSDEDFGVVRVNVAM